MSATIQGFDVAAKIEEWRKIRAQRLELEALAKKISEGPEANLKAEIITFLDATNQTGARSTAGTASKTTKRRIQLRDAELACKIMWGKMTDAMTNGLPLSDCLLFQKTAKQSEIDTLVREVLNVSADTDIKLEDFNAVANQLGMEAVENVDLTFKKS